MKLLNGLRAEPVATTGLVTAVLGLATILGLEPKLAGAIGTLIGALLAFPVRNAVWPQAHVVDAVRTAADLTAESLGPETVGPAGTASPTGTLTAAVAADEVLKGMGVSRRNR